MEKENLLKITHESLEVEFDGDPRPHLIITETPQSMLANKFQRQYPKLAEDITKDQSQSLINCYEKIEGVVKTLLGVQELERFSLVTHIGLFATNQKYFHAHIWMDTDQYKKLLYKAKHVPDTKKFKNLASYEEGVNGYWSKMSNKHKKYLQRETQDIEKAKAGKEKIKVNCPFGYEIIFHQCLPYIGFHCKENKTGGKESEEKPKKEQESKEQENKKKKNEEEDIKEIKSEEKKTGEKKTKAEIFYDVTQFAKDHRMAEEGKDGCHVCLGGQPAIPFSEDVDAFLLASVGTFYKMLCNEDEERANKWWEDFQTSTVANPVLH